MLAPPLLVLAPPLLVVGPPLRRRVVELWSIDYAWNAGVTALKRNGISMKSTPVFLILGSPSPELELTTMDACGQEFAVRGVPEGPAPLHWYANADGIYLVCSEVGWLNRVNRVVQQQTNTAQGSLP